MKDKFAVKEPMALPCLRGVIGNWVYYSSLMSARQIAEWIVPVKSIREAQALDDLLQRSLNDGRKEAISKYLITDETRFFNSIIVGVFDGIPDWLEFDIDKAAAYVQSKVDLKIAKESIGLLIFNGDEKMFAIDGQHRVAGVQIAYRDDKNKALLDDQFSVIFVAHIDDEIGKKRTRKLFSDINKNAKPVAGGDRIKIDEQDLSAIVARRIYAENFYFNKGKLIDLTESANLDKGDIYHFTNLLGIYTVNKILRKYLYKLESKSQQWDEVNVVKLQQIANEFYEYIFNKITEFKLFFKEELTLDLARKENKYILFRPIGLSLIAKLYGFYRSKDKLEKLAYCLENTSFIMPESIYNKILWRQGVIITKNQSLAFDLSLYVFGELDTNKEADLLNRYRKAIDQSEASLPQKIKISI